MKIIDAHMHLVETVAGTGSQGELHYTSNGNARYATGNEFSMIPKELGDGKVTAESLIQLMNDNGVESAVLLQGNYFGFQNLATYEACKKYPNRFVGAATFDVFCRNKEAIIKHLFTDLGFKILKLELSTGSGMMANHYTFSLLDENMMEVYELANRMNLILTIDIGRPGNSCYQVANLAKIIKKYPNITFVICHLTAPQADDYHILKYNLQSLAACNVFFDIAALDRNSKTANDPKQRAMEYIRLAIKIVGSDHIMFGSDVPSTMCHQSYKDMIDQIRQSSLSSNDKENILYNTAKKVYFSKR